MTRQAAVRPDPLVLRGGRTGVLLVHGFTGSPAEMAPIARLLHRKGFTVSVPLLPGHGTTAQDLGTRTWEEWVRHAQAALADLRRSCGSVFVGGFSLGSLIAAELAAGDAEVRGVVLYSPALRLRSEPGLLFHVARRFVRLVPKAQYQQDDTRDPAARSRLWAYDMLPLAALAQVLKLARRVRGRLSLVRCPALVVHSVLDRSIHETSAQETFDGLGSAEKRMVTLRDSGHALTVDREWKEVAAQTAAFIAEHAARRKASGARR